MTEINSDNVKIGVDNGSPEGDRHIVTTVMPDVLTMVEKLKEFMDAFESIQHKHPTVVDSKTALLCSRLMISEATESMEAMANEDLIEILDGLVDELYVTVFTAITYGLGDILMDAFDLVHKNNMSKLGPDGKPLKDASGKVIKPAGYVPVDLSPLLQKAMYKRAIGCI